MRSLILVLAVFVFCAPPVDAGGSSSGGKPARLKKNVKKKRTSTRAAGTKRARKGKRGREPRRGARRRRGTRQRARSRTESQEGIATPARRDSPRRTRTPRQSPERRSSMHKREKSQRKVRVKEKWTTADGVQRSKVFETRPSKGPRKTTTADLIASGTVSNNGILNAQNTLATVKAAQALAKINKLSSGRGG